jgi:hydrogenase maturation factor HypF (carbamoyltransferase family)
MKEAVVLVSREMFGNIHGALLNTFPFDWKVQVFVVTNQIVADYEQEFGSLFLDKYKEAVAKIIRQFADSDVKFYVVMGGAAFLNVILVQELLKYVEADRIVLLVYRKFEKKYGAFTLDGKVVSIGSEALDKPSLLGD